VDIERANFKLKMDEQKFLDSDLCESDRFISVVDMEKAKASGDWSVIKEQMRRYLDRSLVQPALVQPGGDDLISVGCGVTSDEVVLKPVCVDLEVKSLVPVLICPLKIVLDLPVKVSFLVVDYPVKIALDLPVRISYLVVECPVECFMVLPAITAVLVWDVPVVPDIVFEMSPAFIERECEDDNLRECVDVIKDDNLEVCMDVIKGDNLIECVDVLSDDNVMMEINTEVMDDKRMMDEFICDKVMVDGFSWMDFPTPPEIFRDVWSYLHFALVGIG